MSVIEAAAGHRPDGLLRAAAPRRPRRREAALLADAFKALGDPVRLQLLNLIATAEGGEACACDLVEPVGRSQPTVSHHLRVLREAGLVASEKRGTWVWYRAEAAQLEALRRALAAR